MASVKHWLSAARPRTLLLAVATVILGSALAWNEGRFSGHTFAWAFLLALSIQVLANFANDWGDFRKGTDTTGKRQGPVRALQSGNITHRQMKRAVGIMAVFAASTGILLVATSLGTGKYFFLMLGMGALCILAALFYTMGKHAYGYKGWGDFFAFLFFGPVPVIGTYFLHTHAFDFKPVLPAVGIGLVSTMILNVNNMRDIDNDRASGKMTIAVRLGLKKAKLYHTLLTFGMFACFLQYSFTYASSPWYRYIYAMVFLFQFFILSQIHKKKDRALDPYLKLTAMAGFLLAVIFSICINI